MRVVLTLFMTLLGMVNRYGLRLNGLSRCSLVPSQDRQRVSFRYQAGGLFRWLSGSCVCWFTDVDFEK